MSLFFKGERRGQVTATSDDGWTGAGSTNPSGRATHLIPVFASLRHITDFASTLPVDTYWKNADGTRTPAPTPPLLRVLEGRFEQGIGTWFGQAAFGLAADGNAVGWVSGADGFGRPARVHWLERADWAFDEWNKQWYVFGQPVPASRIFHIPWMVPPGKTLGLSPIEHAAATIGAGLSAQEYADVRRGGGIPPTTLKNEAQTVDAEVASRIERRLEQKFAAGRPFVHGKDWTFSTVTIPPNHAQFIETMKLSANQVAAIYGIDPTAVGGEAANSQEYSNPEMRQIDRAASMRPYLVRLENAVSRIIGERTFVRFNIDATIRVDMKARTEVQKLEVEMGKKSVNEIRANDDLSPVQGGDFHNVPTKSVAPTERNPS